MRVYFPGDGVWYGVRDGESYRGGDEREIAAPLPTIPVFQAGGTIVPRQMRLRRSSAQMGHDPYTLVVAADADGVRRPSRDCLKKRARAATLHASRVIPSD